MPHSNKNQATAGVELQSETNEINDIARKITALIDAHFQNSGLTPPQPIRNIREIASKLELNKSLSTKPEEINALTSALLAYRNSNEVHSNSNENEKFNSDLNKLTLELTDATTTLATKALQLAGKLGRVFADIAKRLVMAALSLLVFVAALMFITALAFYWTLFQSIRAVATFVGVGLGASLGFACGILLALPTGYYEEGSLLNKITATLLAPICFTFTGGLAGGTWGSSVLAEQRKESDDMIKEHGPIMFQWAADLFKSAISGVPVEKTTDHLDAPSTASLKR